ncbi:hypothetical protein SV7mr_23800 [Stieleria bergensis]|uniref:Uncharacterized protein n=1 Tax=Stieleria bergensis TaxID=2528025 RepID=A0A517SUS5_9BACT|nr:hypothetical protein SV7mr_23800 [Planctomycetes bacterium SV_7m_r]
MVDPEVGGRVPIASLTAQSSSAPLKCTPKRQLLLSSISDLDRLVLDFVDFAKVDFFGKLIRIRHRR